MRFIAQIDDDKILGWYMLQEFLEFILGEEAATGLAQIIQAFTRGIDSILCRLILALSRAKIGGHL